MCGLITLNGFYPESICMKLILHVQSININGSYSDKNVVYSKILQYFAVILILLLIFKTKNEHV